ncbi:MAG: hypothetical protein Q9218_003548 [Villophora microphyllina]
MGDGRKRKGRKGNMRTELDYIMTFFLLTPAKLQDALSVKTLLTAHLKVFTTILHVILVMAGYVRGPIELRPRSGAYRRPEVRKRPHFVSASLLINGEVVGALMPEVANFRNRDQFETHRRNSPLLDSQIRVLRSLLLPTTFQDG